MPSIEKIVRSMRCNPDGCRFDEVKRVCDRYFGPSRIHGSHHVYRMPWQGDPRINIQNRHGCVAGYQVKQVLDAIDRLEREHG